DAGEVKWRAVQPQSFIDVFSDQPSWDQRQFYVTNSETMETQLLDGHGWECDVDDRNGLAVLYDGDGRGQYANRKLALHLFKHNQLGTRLYRGDLVVGSISELRARHTLVKVPIAKSEMGTFVNVQVALFSFPSVEGRVFVDICSLWRNFDWKFSPGSGSAWFQHRVPKWEKLVKQLNLGDAAYRRSLPYASLPAEDDDSIDIRRCFLFPSLSVPLFLAHFVNSIGATAKQGGAFTHPEARAGCRHIVSYLLSFVKPNTVFQLRLGKDVRRVGNMPKGDIPAAMRVSDDLSACFLGFDDVRAPPEIRQEAKKVVLKEWRGKQFQDAAIKMITFAVQSKKASMTASVATQVLWQVSQIIEDKYIRSAQVEVRGSDGTSRALQPRPSDVDAQIERSKVWDPKNKRHVKRELWRYQEACKQEMTDRLFYSMAGPDATKVGADLGIQGAFIMNAESGIVAVQKTYLTHFECAGEEGRKHGLSVWKKRSLRMANEQAGIQTSGKDEPVRKRRRMKTYHAMLTVHNMLLQTTGKGIERFHIKQVDGKYTDPFQWAHLNLSTDQGPDNVCMQNYLTAKGFNVHTDWDLSHGAHNDVCKDSFKQRGLWRHSLRVMSAMNCACGGTLSPPRLQQIREAAAEYMSTVNCRTDPWFQFWMPHIVKQQKLDIDISADDASEKVWRVLQTAPILWWKGAKANFAKYFLFSKKSEEDLSLFAVKACLYGYVCAQFGYKAKKAPAGPAASAASSSGPAIGADATVKQAAKATTEDTLKGENQLHGAAMLYADVQAFHTQCIIAHVTKPARKWHSDQNTTLREGGAAIPWETRMLNGEPWEHLEDTVKVIGINTNYNDMGIESEWPPTKGISVDSPRISQSDDFARMLWDLCFSIVGHRRARLLQLSDGYPRQFTLLLNEGSRAAVLKRFKDDFTNHLAVCKVDAAWAKGFAERSPFKSMSVIQIGLAFQVEKWQWTERMNDLLSARMKRIIVSQLVEDLFNRAKKNVDLGSNTQCCIERAWALPIDKRVASSVHKYKEVDHTSVLFARSAELEDECFRPPLRPDRQSEAVRELKLNQVIGYGEASWYSPGASRAMTPIAEMLALRDVTAAKDLSLCQKLWMGRLVSTRMLFRKKGTQAWYIGVGDIVSTLAVGWPAVRVHPSGVYAPQQGGVKPGLFAVFDLSKWEACSIEICSPLHNAIVAEGGKDGKEVSLQRWSHYGDMGVLARTSGPIAPLLNVAARQAFGRLPLSFLKVLSEELGVGGGVTLVEVLRGLIKHIFPEITDDDLLAILRQREYNYEEVDDMADVMDDEIIVESFDTKDQVTLKKELETLKMSNDEVREYKSAVRDLHHALLGDKKIGDLKAAARRRMRDLKYPKKIFKTPIGHDDLPQAQAKLLLPPGATVWRGNQVGSWQVHVKPHPRHSERWAKHGNNSYNAMLAAVRFAWSQWLGDHMLDSKDCPIDGVF
ncbi:unnamed protein product, partial [Prorocentrum cordatum]